MGNVYRQIDAVQAQETHTASVSLTSNDSFKTHNVATDAIVITLPAISASSIGERFTFRNTGADGAVLLTVSPASTDAIFGSIANSAADSVASGVLDKDIKNTKATANKGDYIVLEANAVGAWYIVGGVGIWASEA